MEGTERFECVECGASVWPSEAANYPMLRFVLDRPRALFSVREAKGGAE